MSPQTIVLLVVCLILVVIAVDFRLVFRVIRQVRPQLLEILDPSKLGGDFPLIDVAQLNRDPDRLRQYKLAREGLIRGVVEQAAGLRRKAMLLGLVPLCLMTAALTFEAWSFRDRVVNAKEVLAQSVYDQATQARMDALAYLTEALDDARRPGAIPSTNVGRLEVKESLRIASDQTVDVEMECRVSHLDPLRPVDFSFDVGRRMDADRSRVGVQFDGPSKPEVRLNGRRLADDEVRCVPRALERSYILACTVHLPAAQESKLVVRWGLSAQQAQGLVSTGALKLPLFLCYMAPARLGVERVDAWSLDLEFERELLEAPNVALLSPLQSTEPSGWQFLTSPSRYPAAADRAGVRYELPPRELTGPVVIRFRQPAAQELLDQIYQQLVHQSFTEP